MSPPARAHCRRGHPLAGENRYVTPGGELRCRECDRQSRRLRRRKEARERRRAGPLRHCVICGRFLPRALRADAVICSRAACIYKRQRKYWRRLHGKGIRF
jgi:predicted nucleic acid-binding Zn ribbon protein